MSEHPCGLRGELGPELRTITVVYQIVDQELAGVLWDAHVSGALLNGMRAVSIIEGDASCELAMSDKAEVAK